MKTWEVPPLGLVVREGPTSFAYTYTHGGAKIPLFNSVHRLGRGMAAGWRDLACLIRPGGRMRSGRFAPLFRGLGVVWNLLGAEEIQDFLFGDAGFEAAAAAGFVHILGTYKHAR